MTTETAPATTTPSNSDTTDPKTTGTAPPADAGKTVEQLGGEKPKATEEKPAKEPAAKDKAPEKPAAEGEKPADEKGAAAPDYSALKLPSALPSDDPLLGKAREVFGAHKVPVDGAQALLDLYAQAAKEAGDRAQAEYAATVKGWGEEVHRDLELGQANLGATKAAAAKAIDTYGNAALRQILNDTGVGNHPEVVRFMARVGRTLTEDTLVGAGRSTAANGDARSLYPNTPGMNP